MAHQWQTQKSSAHFAQVDRSHTLSVIQAGMNEHTTTKHLRVPQTKRGKLAGGMLEGMLGNPADVELTEEIVELAMR